jgi:large subunit ribosomal protein L30e
MADLEQLRAALPNVIIGSRQVTRALKTGKLKLVILAANCPVDISRDISYYAKLAKTPVERFKGDARELGMICGKPFLVAVVAVPER